MCGPRKYDDAGHGAHTPEVDHPDGFLDVEVVEYSTAVYAVVGGLSVDCPGRMAVHPLVLVGVPLVLTTIIDERFFLERQVLHCPRTNETIRHSVIAKQTYRQTELFTATQ